MANADFESIVRSHVSEDGTIHEEAIVKLVKAISSAVGNEFVDKARYKAKLEEIDTLKGEKQTAEDSATTAEKWKTKYNALKEDFDAYKKDQDAKVTRGAKEKAYRELLSDVGISEKRLDKVLRLCDVDSVELDESGKIKDADALKKSIKEEWSDFIVTTHEVGVQIANPPVNNGSPKLSMTDIYKKDEHGRYVMSTAERQKALAENQIIK